MLATVSAAGTTLLMLHFVHRLRKSAAQDPEAAAPASLALPWLLIALASVAVPWGMYLSVPSGTVSNPLAPAALWAALWPVLAGSALAFALARSGQCLPRVPEGDIAAAIDPATRASVRWGGRLERADGVLRRWPAASFALLVLAIAFGAAMLAGR